MNTLENYFVSISKLQKNAKICLSIINSVGKKIILSNNKTQTIIFSYLDFPKNSI